MQNTNIERGSQNPKNVVVYDLTLTSPDRSTKDIKSLKSALERSESVVLPNRHLLYDIYHDLTTLDGHLSGILQKRTDAVLNKSLSFLNKEGQKIEAFDNLIYSNKFNNFLKLILDSKYWGVSGAEFLIGKKFDYVEVPRKHINIDKGFILKSQYSSTGIPIADLPQVFTIGEKNDLGQLLRCALYSIYKRGAFGDFAQFVEIFGQPVRLIYYDAYDTKVKEELKKVLNESGSSLAMMIPKQAEFEMLDGKTSNGNGDLQINLITACNAEMSIAILGNTETTSSSSSSGYAQSKEHSKQQLEITKSDLAFVRNLLNDEKFLNILRGYGYPVDQGSFEFEMELDLDNLKKRLEIDEKVSTKVPVEDDYWYMTYGIPKPKNYEALKKEKEEKEKAQVVAQQNANPIVKEEKTPDTKPDVKVKTKQKDLKDLFDQLKDFFFGGNEISLNELYEIGEIDFDLADNFEEIYSQLAGEIYGGKLPDNYVHPELYFETVDKLKSAISEGLGGKSFNYDDSKNVLQSYLQNNIYRFAAAKCLTELLEFRNAMIDPATGEIISFSKYKQIIANKGYLFSTAYLNAEYNIALQSSIMAHKWESIDSVYLEYSTVGDEHVRLSHREWDGHTFLKSDPIWNIIYPPNGWGCRCTVVPGVAKNYNGASTKEYKEKSEDRINNPLFENNVGKSRVIFKGDHPYFLAAKSKKAKVLDYIQYGMPHHDNIGTVIMQSDYVKTSLEEYHAWWKQQSNGDNDNIIIEDKLGNTILFDGNKKNMPDYGKFKDHILKKKKENRFEYATNFPEIVQKPDEIWLGINDETTYIKFYKDKTICVQTSQNLKANTMYDLQPDRIIELRRGTLKYKSY
ncbi:MAG: DUF935 family protein [Lentimicrobium sp.]|jgi:SPP1 gp7 family putative phage head morphogenesis protein|nr:DUF935 family protein [Lentimicrobium sp.]